MSHVFFNGVTAAQDYKACILLPKQSRQNTELSLYASGPKSGTWTATVRFLIMRGDGELSLVASCNLNQDGPNPGGTGTRVYDAVSIWLNPDSVVYADVINPTGTIPAPGLYAEGN